MTNESRRFYCLLLSAMLGLSTVCQSLLSMVYSSGAQTEKGGTAKMLTSHSAYFLEGKNLASFGLMKTTHLRIHPCGLSAPNDLKPPPISPPGSLRPSLPSTLREVVRSTARTSAPPLLLLPSAPRLWRVRRRDVPARAGSPPARDLGAGGRGGEGGAVGSGHPLQRRLPLWRAGEA